LQTRTRRNPMANLNKHLAIMALLAGTALASTPALAQDNSNTGGMDQAPAATQDQGGSGAEEILPKGQNQATSGEDATMPDAQTQDQAQEEMLKPKTEDQATSPRQDNDGDVAQDPSDDTRRDRTTAEGERRQDQNAGENTATDTRTKTQDDTTAAEGRTNDDNQDQAASDKPSDVTTGSINISAEQKTVIKNTIIETKVKPVDVDFKVSIGVSVPRTIELHPLPPTVVEVVPAYRDYVYFVMADGTIVIVDPSSYEVVYVLTA
jgi:hypothetical protein